MRDRWGLGVVACLYAQLALLPLAPAIFRDRDVAMSDLTLFEQPRDRLIAQAWRDGDALPPRWAPGVWGGASAVGAPELGLFYPPVLVLGILTPDRARALGVALHLLLAAFGARSLALAYGVDRRAAVLAGLVFAFGGWLLATHFWSPYVRSTAWLPWALAGVRRGSRGEPGGLGLAALALAGMLLGGDPQGFACAGAVAVVSSGAADGARAAARAFLLCAVAALAAIALAAVQVLPAVSAIAESVRREGIPWAQATRFSIFPLELAGLLVPFFFGANVERQSLWSRAVFPSGEPSLVETYYVGAPVLALVAIALVRLRREPAARAGLALLLLFTPFALGRYTPLYRLFFALPGGDAVRFPAKLFVPAWLGLSLLAAAGASSIGAAVGRRERRVGAGVLASAAVLGLAGVSALLLAGEAMAERVDVAGGQSVSGAGAVEALIPRFAHVVVVASGALAQFLGSRREGRAGRLAPALVVLVAADLAVANRAAILLLPRAPLARPPRAAAVLEELSRKEGAPARVVPSAEASRATAEDYTEFPPEAVPYLSDREALLPNAGLGQGVLSQGGFLASPPYRAVMVAIRTVSRPERLKLTGARYALLLPIHLRDVGRRARVVAPDVNGRMLVELVEAPHWAALYARVRHVGGLEAALEEITKPDFDPREEAVVEATPEAEGDPAPSARGTATLASGFGANRFEVRVDAAGPRWLVVREAFARGWRATVDGREAPVVAADAMFRAVHLPGGARSVVFEYEAPLLVEGALVSSVALLGFLLAAWLARRRRARAR